MQVASEDEGRKLASVGEASVGKSSGDEGENGALSDSEDAAIQNQVVARSNMGTAFYLFNHQAGGHKPFLRSGRGEVCKPAIPLELKFYQALDTRFPQLKPFVPPFVGVITVELHPMTPVVVPCDREKAETSENAVAVAGERLGKVNLSSTSPPPPPIVDTTPPPAQTKKRRLGAGIFSGSPTSPTRSFLSTTSYSAKLWRKERNSITSKAKGASTSSANSNSLQRSNSSAVVTTTPQEYLVLGDLTQHYSRPCVLDVKMGTRQHGEDATPAKVKSHSAKCAATTSLSLGLRICGMQIYDEVEQRYILWDKHWGRQLKTDDIEPALSTYLTKASGLHWESLEALLHKLLELKRVITTTTGVRFWGASLLLIYEGDLRHAQRRESIHFIDFAHSQISDELVTPDEGLLLGLTNMATFLSNILARRPKDQDVSGEADVTTTEEN
ncbi:hypothetical protein Poli38472_000411 [Pythium oligandrum]|uniref:Kinase n=1 Tax=Pythium oligandrum TaxID=41045 RepID=A0A8K1CBL1_PYTOL|nr:hypothetical protein Poli38472_000411 [Pythium oligandrum]|eukprot:TMW60369.1 hypothetical protein Poli38472_000411 [Pythium oligandrum]